jgi:hypothetical protein
MARGCGRLLRPGDADELVGAELVKLAVPGGVGWFPYRTTPSAKRSKVQNTFRIDEIAVLVRPQSWDIG